MVIFIMKIDLVTIVSIGCIFIEVAAIIWFINRYSSKIASLIDCFTERFKK